MLCILVPEITGGEHDVALSPALNKGERRRRSMRRFYLFVEYAQARPEVRVCFRV